MQNEVEKFLVNQLGCVSLHIPSMVRLRCFYPSPPGSLKHLHCNKEMLGNCFCSDDCSLQKTTTKKMPWCTDNIDFLALNIKRGSSKSVTKLTLDTLQGAWSDCMCEWRMMVFL